MSLFHIKNEFLSVIGQDAHIERGRQMLRAHPELQELYGPYPLSALYVVILVAIQLGLAGVIGEMGWGWLVLCSYTIGACINLCLFTMIHEVSHNLIFKRPALNFLTGFVANVPLVVPLSVNYRYYHLSHHRFMGQSRRDVDMPVPSEAAWVGNIWWRKALWLVFFFWPYGVVRSLANRTVPKFDRMIAFNAAFQVCCLVGIFTAMGSRGLIYLALSTIFSISVSPAFGARGLLEHFVVADSQETYSYYGPYNKISFNNGYHFEHHDLMGIAWKRLPRIREIAPEFYHDLYAHRSYFALIWRFISDPEYSLYRRLSRSNISGERRI